MTLIAFFGGECFEFPLLFFVFTFGRFTGLFEIDRLLSDSDSDGSDTLSGVNIAVKCLDFLVFAERVNFRSTFGFGFSDSDSEFAKILFSFPFCLLGVAFFSDADFFVEDFFDVGDGGVELTLDSESDALEKYT